MEKDIPLAVHWFTEAANRGDAYSQNVLGMCYENGWGVPRNYIQMSHWYKKAAAQGEENAIEALKRLQND
ncbi:MAG: hypothetical protein K2K70_11640 [Lachnospiraceae bacterium]|nr:hypothetical protein [Lachnospiraceae bacterium]